MLKRFSPANPARRSHRWLREKWYRTPLSITGVASFFFWLFLQLSGYQSQDLARDVAIGGVLAVALLVILVRKDTDRGTPRAWARVDTPNGESWRVRADGTGQAISEPVTLCRDDRKPATPSDDGMSLALAPDAAVLAIVARGRLSILTLNPRDASIHSWAGRITIPPRNPRVLAVARKGDREVWCALVDDDRIRMATLAKSAEMPVWSELGQRDNAGGTYAAFLGSRLLFVRDGEVCEAFAGQTRSWTPRNWQQPHDERVIAIDTATISGRSFVALLTQAARDGNTGEAAKTRLIVVPADENGYHHESDLEVPANHVSLVRAPGGDPRSVCVLAGAGTEMKIIYPFRPSNPGSGIPKTPGKRRLVRGRRRRKPETEANPRGVSV